MSQPSGPAPAAPAQPSGHRDMMFCHECQDEWYRDMHGLTCPECGSDFTEIVSPLLLTAITRVSSTDIAADRGGE